MQVTRIGWVLFVGLGVIAQGACAQVEATTTSVAVAAMAAAKPVTLHVAKPMKGARAKAPPKGAKPTHAVSLDKGIKWKTDAKSHAVFAVGHDKSLWFLDPTTGWPYTIDKHGMVFTADPVTGAVYSLGAMAHWSGAVPYFFALWKDDGGSWSVPTYTTYVTVYSDPADVGYDYDTAYSEVWTYDEYFSSEEVTEETVSYEETTEEITETSSSEESSESSSESSSSEDSSSEHDGDGGDSHDDGGANDEPADQGGSDDDGGGDDDHAA